MASEPWQRTCGRSWEVSLANDSPCSFVMMIRLRAILRTSIAAARLHRGGRPLLKFHSRHYAKATVSGTHSAPVGVCACPKTRALLLTLTDPPCGQTSQGMARLPSSDSSSDHMRTSFPLDPAWRVCPRITRELRPETQLATMWAVVYPVRSAQY